MLKMAIVGAGTWGESHARIYADHPGAEVVAICDVYRERAEQFAARHHLNHVYTDCREMLEVRLRRCRHRDARLFAHRSRHRLRAGRQAHVD